MKIKTTRLVAAALAGLLVFSKGHAQENAQRIQLPKSWAFSKPLIAPEDRIANQSRAQKDPTVVFADNQWHVFMTVKLPGKSAIEYCSFSDWDKANNAPRTLLPISDSDYFCAPQVFYFRPHKKWYLVYQMGVKESKKMWVAYSTTKDISDPKSWTTAKPMLDGGAKDPRKVGGLDYWIICDASKAYLFFTSLNGKMWRMSTLLEDFPQGFNDCKVALQANVFEASHTYRIKGQQKYLTLIEANGQRYFKAYIANSLEGNWSPLADTFEKPFASARNIQPASGVDRWTDNVSHGELIRSSNDETLTIDPKNMKFVFQGMLEENKRKPGYGNFQWRIGMLEPKTETEK